MAKLTAWTMERENMGDCITVVVNIYNPLASRNRFLRAVRWV